MSKLTVALIGCGRMGAFTTEQTKSKLPAHWFPLSHLDAIAVSPELTLVATCDANKEAAVAAAVGSGLPASAAWDNATEMLDSVRPDIVAVATRSATRPAILRAAISAGVKGIHTEKPLCPRLADAVEITGAIEAANIEVTYGTVRRFMPAYSLAKQMLDQGEIGPLRSVTARFGVDDLLLWTHPHTVDLLLFFCGTDLRSVAAECIFEDEPEAPFALEFDPRVSGAHFTFADGVTAIIENAAGGEIILTGEAGSISVTGNEPEVRLTRNGATAVHSVPSSPSGTVAAFATLVDKVKGRKPASNITAHEIRTNQRALFSMALSGLRSGSSLTPEELPSNFTIRGRFRDAYS